jgi:hypothetical protein
MALDMSAHPMRRAVNGVCWTPVSQIDSTSRTAGNIKIDQPNAVPLDNSMNSATQSAGAEDAALLYSEFPDVNEGFVRSCLTRSFD